MNIKVPQIIDVLMKYGSFARPLVNWVLKAIINSIGNARENSIVISIK